MRRRAELVARFGRELAVAPALSTFGSTFRTLALDHGHGARSVGPGVGRAALRTARQSGGDHRPPPPAATPPPPAMPMRRDDHRSADHRDGRSAGGENEGEPEDGAGWVLLGRSYLKLGRYDDSVAAFAEAARRMPENAGLLTDQAEAVAFAQGQRLAGRPTELLKRALVLEPDYPKAIAMTAAAAAERNDFDGAIKLYQRLKADGSGRERGRAGDRSSAGGTRRRAQGHAGTGHRRCTGHRRTRHRCAAKRARGPTERSRSCHVSGVEGRVEIDPKLAAKVAPGDTLFIYARDPDGSRMPLAILRGTASELPKSFALTDAMAMTPNNTISRARQSLSKRASSKSGNATPQSGDLRGTSAPRAARCGQSAHRHRSGRALAVTNCEILGATRLCVQAMQRTSAPSYAAKTIACPSPARPALDRRRFQCSKRLTSLRDAATRTFFLGLVQASSRAVRCS